MKGEITVKNLFAREFCKLWLVILFVSAFLLIALGTVLIVFCEALMKVLLCVLGFGLFACGIASLVFAIYLLGHTAICLICKKKQMK